MTIESIPHELTDEQLGQIAGVFTVGCDEETAAHIVGCSPATLRRAIAADPMFTVRLDRARAAAELGHMQNVHQAGKDVKHWRASVWWLERHSPERFARRAPGAITPRQLTAFAEVFADALKIDVRDEDDRRRVLARLQNLAKSAEQIVRNAEPDESSTASVGGMSLLENREESELDDHLDENESEHDVAEEEDLNGDRGAG